MSLIGAMIRHHSWRLGDVKAEGGNHRPRPLCEAGSEQSASHLAVTSSRVWLGKMPVNYDDTRMRHSPGNNCQGRKLTYEMDYFLPPFLGGGGGARRSGKFMVAIVP